MRGGDRYRDRDLEDYEEDEGYEDEEEAEFEEKNNQEEDEPPLTKDQLEYLERREKLKRMIRQRMIKENGLVVASSKEKKAPTNGSFGSFFGPSQPVIAKRVIEEGRGFMDLRLIAVNGQKTASQGQNKNGQAATNVIAKSIERKQLPKVVDKVKLKTQKLKEARDYSFLFSGEEFPVPVKESAPPHKTIPTSDARTSKVTANGKPSMSKAANQTYAVHGKNGTVATGKPLSKGGLQKSAPCSKLSGEAGKLLGANMGIGPGWRHVGMKVSDQKSHGSSSSEKKVVHAMNKSTPSVGASKTPLPKPQVVNQKRYSAQEREPLRTDKPAAKVVAQRPASTPAKMASHQQTSASAKMASHQQTSASANMALLRQKSGSSSLASQRPKPALTIMASQGPKSASANMDPQRPSSIKQQNVKVMKQPLKAVSSDRQKKRTLEEYSDEYEDEDEDEDEGGGGDYRSLIRQMFRYNPKKYAGMDDDDSDMEVGFSRIEAEERRSAKIAKEEDERELALIEEEERRERQRRETKRLKMNHSQR